MINKTKLKQD